LPLRSRFVAILNAYDIPTARLARIYRSASVRSLPEGTIEGYGIPIPSLLLILIVGSS
jgi:D-xylose transport system permease protein